MRDRRVGNLSLGVLPRVVGTIFAAESLRSAPSAGDYVCDLVEMRLDAIGIETDGWLRVGEAIEAAGYPVLVTLRLAAEGGRWEGGDAARESFLSPALETLSCVDVEWASEVRPRICRLAERLGKSVIVSYHDFGKTPDFRSLKQVLDAMQEVPCAIPKIATMITREEDGDTLRRLLETGRDRPRCVIGMGSLGTPTRVLFPSLGSCLAYGYLDSPSAPGQLSAAALVRALRQTLPEYDRDFAARVRTGTTRRSRSRGTR